jgi:hypothetical protein
MRVVGAWLRERHQGRLVAAGHRVVHGGPDYDQPVLINKEVLRDLERYVPLAPLHQPNSLAPIHAVLDRRPDLPPGACFDTSLHRGHSLVANHYAIPEHFFGEGVRRYGFHGLSYEYVFGRLCEVAPEIANGRVIVAHLGSGASLCAISQARSIESTLGFTVVGFEASFVNLLKLGFVLPGRSASLNGYELHSIRDAPRTDGSRRVFVLFLARDFASDGSDIVDSQVGLAVRNAYPILAIADERDQIPPVLVGAEKLAFRRLSRCGQNGRPKHRAARNSLRRNAGPCASTSRLIASAYTAFSLAWFVSSRQRPPNSFASS